MSKKISELPDASTLFPATVFPLVNPEGTRKTTLQSVANFIGAQNNAIESLANIAALGALSTTNLADGLVVFVQSNKSWWTLLKSETGFTADGITCVAAATSGSWRRIDIAHPSWATVADWYINAATGNDENSGQSSGTPLKTHAELERRLGRNRIVVPVSVGSQRVCTINILTTLPATDPINFFAAIPSDTTIVYKGTVENTLYSGTFTSVTTRVASTNTPWDVTDTALAAANSWTGYLTERVRITSGASINCVSWVAKDLGSKKARMSEFVQLFQTRSPASWPLLTIDSTAASKTPVVGDTFSIEQVSVVTLGVLAPNIVNASTGFSVQRIIMMELTFRDCEPTIVGTAPGGNSPVVFSACKFGAISLPVSLPICISNCCLNGATIPLYGGASFLTAGLVTGTGAGIAGFGGNIVIGVDTIFQGVSLKGNGIVIGSCGIFDVVAGILNYGGHGVVVGRFIGGATPRTVPGGCIALQPQNGQGYLWGSGNAGSGVFVEAGSSFLYGTGLVARMTITGATPGTNDFSLNGATTARAWDETSGAFTTARASSWANLALAVGSGGFGGNANDIASGARITAEA